MGTFSSCSEDNEEFITATEDDFPQILLPWFSEWENGEPVEYKNLSRDVEFVDSATVTPALYTTVQWLIDDEVIHEGLKIQHTFLAGEYVLKIVATTTKGNLHPVPVYLLSVRLRAILFQAKTYSTVRLYQVQ